MKNLNKVLAMLVVFMMVVSTVAFASFTDVAEDSTYNVAIKVGTDLGLFTGYEDGSFKPEGEITRAEFAAIVVRMKGQEAQAEGAKSATMFTDVPADHWAAGYINIAVRLGIINGYGDGNFGPSDLVEYQDAITMMVRALGYDPAIGAAGYPTGYLTKAGDLGLTANVSGVNGVAINRGKVAQIVFNALDVPLMTQSGYGTFTQYVVNDGFSSTGGTTNVKKTILSENHSIFKIQGTIKDSSIAVNATETGTEKVTFDITNTLNNKYGEGSNLKLLDKGETAMEAGESDVSDYVGKKVVAFVHVNEFEGTKTVVSVYDAPVLDTLTVSLQDLDVMPLVSANWKGQYDFYNENGRIASVKAEAIDDPATTSVDEGEPDVYINGVSIDDMNNDTSFDQVAELNRLSGTITFALLNSTSKGDYDTIYIEAASAFVVDEVKKSNSTVKSKFGLNRIYFDSENALYEATLCGADGAEMDWADLEENDVLMVKYVETTSNKKIYDAKVVNNVITDGKVDGLSSNPGDITREAVINGVAYKVAIGAEPAGKALRASDEGTFYLDENDNIVYFDITSTVSKNYGYVIATSEPQAGNFLSGYQVQMLTKDNSIVVYDLYKKINYDGNTGVEVISDTFSGSTKTNDAATNLSSNVLAYDGLDSGVPQATLSGIVGQVITYNVNSANEITAIFVADNRSGYTDEQLDREFTKDDRHGTADLTNFDPDDMTFGKYTIDEETVIFFIEDTTSTATIKKTAEVVSVPVLEEDDKFANATLYNVDADDYVSCILITGRGSVIGGQSEHATFILKVSEGTDDELNTIYTVTGYKDGEVVTYTVKDASILPDANSDGVCDLIGTLVIPVYQVNGDIKAFNTATGDYKKHVQTYDFDNAGKIVDGNKLYIGSWTDSNANGLWEAAEGAITYAATPDVKIKSGANVYVYDATKAAKGRGHYQIDADGYLDWDAADGIYYGTKASEKNLKVMAMVFYTDATPTFTDHDSDPSTPDVVSYTANNIGDAVDVLYIIY